MRFQAEVLQRFQSYQIPVIKLKKSVQKEAVCHVFEKVNTGGVVLNAFELLTATIRRRKLPPARRLVRERRA